MNDVAKEGPGRGGATEVEAALAALRAAFGMLAAQLGPADAADLAALDAALDRIASRRGGSDAAPGPLPGDDDSRLDRLLALAGPQDAPELLRRIRADLAGAARQIEAALPGADRQALRAASHVLIAVAGSVGAFALERDARGLNTLAHADEAAAAALAAAAQPVLQGIARLSRCLAMRHGGPG